MPRQFFLALALACYPVAAFGQIRITEFMSEGQGLTGMGSGANRQREFFELTNLGTIPIDVTNWSYNDNNVNDPHNFGLSFGVIAPGESTILTQMTAADFRTYWNLPITVKVFSYGSLSNLGNADTINIYNSSTQDLTTLVDTLTYVDTARGSGISRNRPQDGATGQYLNTAWNSSGLGDSYGSILAPNPIFPAGPEYIDLANPGLFVPVAVPEPASLGLVAVASLLALRRWRATRP